MFAIKCFLLKGPRLMTKLFNNFLSFCEICVNIKLPQSFLILSLASIIGVCCVADTPASASFDASRGSRTAYKIDHAQGEIAGEPTQSSIILQSRLTRGRDLIEADMPGAIGVGCFELSESPDFNDSFKTKWIKATPENDFIIKQKVNNLRSGIRYYYRVLYGSEPDNIKTGNTCTFKTLDGPDVEKKVTFVVVTGMNYHRFHYGSGAYKGPDKNLGYPALKTILDMQPDFFVATGDNVYYDYPRETAAKTRQQLRKKWHQQFAQARYIELFARIPTYWEKDDHDFRYDDCDNTGDRGPTPKLGIKTFLEQVPVVDITESEPLTYRTYRVNKLLQIWLVEGRNYRTGNNMPDGPDKTIWGKEQKQWLKTTLLESKATFKILISPTPMVGPDDIWKRDNHTNLNGFRYEANEFFSWLGKNGFPAKNFYIVCGDRHWQYHSIHPTGFEEFSCGALVDANARLGRKPGDPNSTDPQALINQPFIQKQASGGFLTISIEPTHDKKKPSIRFVFYDENGTSLYQCKKIANNGNCR